MFLGGEASFGRGGYAGTPLAGLMPWSIGTHEPEMQRGRFPVSVPAAAADHPIVNGIAALLAEHAGEGRDARAGDGSADPAAAARASIESVNLPGNLRPGAVVLLHAAAGSHIVPVVAVQTVGKGRTLGIGSNTLCGEKTFPLWRTESPMRPPWTSVSGMASA